MRWTNGLLLVLVCALLFSASPCLGQDTGSGEPTAKPPSERQSVYDRLRLSLTELATLSESLEGQLASLSDDNLRLSQLLSEQQGDYLRLRQQLAALQSSYDQSRTQSTSLRQSIEDMTAENMHLTSDLRIASLVWQIGIPAALVVGVVAALLVKEMVDQVDQRVAP